MAFEGLVPDLGTTFLVVATLLGSLTILSIYMVLGIELLNTFKFDFNPPPQDGSCSLVCAVPSFCSRLGCASLSTSSGLSEVCVWRSPRDPRRPRIGRCVDVDCAERITASTFPPLLYLAYHRHFRRRDYLGGRHGSANIMLYGGQTDFDKTVVPLPPCSLSWYPVMLPRRHDVQHPRASDFLVRRKRLLPRCGILW